eukprot:gene1140-3578_t
MKPTSIARPTLGVYRRPVMCHAVKPAPEPRQIPIAIASVLAAAMVSGAFVPDEAFAARSGGRAGGSNFSSTRRAPARAAPAAPSPLRRLRRLRHGHGLWNGHGHGLWLRKHPVIVPSAGSPVSVVFNVVSSASSGSGEAGSPPSKKKDDDWGNL